MKVKATTIAAALLVAIAFQGPAASGQTLFIRSHDAPVWELYRGDNGAADTYAGYSRFLSSEPGYRSGTFSFSGTDHLASRDPVGGGDAAPQTWNGLSLHARIPLSRGFGLYARSGALSPHSSDSDDGFLIRQRTFRHNTPFFGAGAEFRLAEPLRLFVEYTRYHSSADEHSLSGPLDEDETRIDTAEVGLTFVF